MTAPVTDTPRRPARGRRLVVVLLVLVGLLVAADFGLAAAGEYQVAQKMRAKFGLSEDPHVRINGFPFLAQAVAGDYRDIEISASGVPVNDQLRDLEIKANLYHVRIGLSPLLSGDTSDARIDQVKGTVKIKASDVNRLVNVVTPFTDMSIEPAELPGFPVSAKQAGVKLGGNTTVAGRKLRITATGVVTLLDGGRVQITTTDVQLDDTSLGALAEVLGAVRQALSVTVDPGNLPFKVTPTSVKVESGALTVEGTVNDIPLDQAAF
ncbi:hypothetical protein GCM10022243_51270 [Saccharothrix violaceirubra]|uniref:DUF2993 family protein n=1 Tax=Saccharothrix violaceirubra TaxID=413306 RepID=A0A7W7WT31_9PSEU|nr:DUF2993 domain-containing protein [Saccharothrix violaceirubra]MBB4962659.1 hypothetical protein [Saccharothrix violaceirubra]